MDNEPNTEQPAPVPTPEMRLVSEIPFSAGQEVVVKRKGKNGQPDTLESGWTVDKFNEKTGKYDVSRLDLDAEQLLEKSFTPAQLTSFQPTPEPAPSFETVDPSEFAPQPEFAVGKEVSVARSTRDSEGNKIIESGWVVVGRDDKAGTVTVESKEELRLGKVGIKTYPVDILRSIQPVQEEPPKQEMITVPDFALESARSMVEGEKSAELHKRAAEDLGEEATPLVVEGPQEALTANADAYLAKLTEGFSEDDKRALADYSISISAAQRTRSLGEFDNARTWEADKQKAFASMSPAAQAVASQYAHADRHYR